MKTQKWVVVYLVKYSEEWCADECSWMEESAGIEASTARAAQREFRRKNENRPRYIIGRHISTTRARI